MHAARNIRMCTKDCLCLYVCPTGATDTENGQIDFSKCLDNCRLCVDACPSHAIYIVNDNYPPPQKKSESVKEVLFDLAKSKTLQSKIAYSIAMSSDNIIVNRLLKAISVSDKTIAEEFIREAGLMLPQSEEVRALLQELLNRRQQDDLPKDVIERLLELL